MKKLFVILVLVFASHVVSSCSNYFTAQKNEKAQTAQNDNFCCDEDDDDLDDLGEGN